MPADLLAHAWIGRRMLAGSRTFATVNPATGELLGRVAESGAEQTQAAIEAARRCFDRTAWAQSPRLRQDSLLAWAAGLEAAAEDAARWLTLTNGKPLAAARGKLPRPSAKSATMRGSPATIPATQWRLHRAKCR